MEERGNIFISLSEKDEGVPETHIGMYSLLRNPKNKGIYTGEERCKKLRQETFMGVLRLYRKYGSPDLADFWNRNAEVIAQIGLNHFVYIQKLAPVAEFIECFLYAGVEADTGWKTICASFGISKQLLNTYLVGLKNGEDPDKDYLRTFLVNCPEREKSRDFILFGGETVDLFNKTGVSIERGAIYRRFCDWCELQGVEKSEGVLMALEALLEAYPLEHLMETTDYDIVTELDIPLFRKPEKTAEQVEKKIIFSGGIFAAAEKIVARYNRDVNNRTKQVSFDTYVNNAVHLLNQTMPEAYRAPELTEEKKEIERMAEYNGF